MRYRLFPLFLAGLAGGLFFLKAPMPNVARAEGEVPAAGVEVQARGAIHEAFAEPAGAQPAPGPVVIKDPPRAIEEAPPEEKPQGDNVVWIPGYWSWDEDASDFVWVSGFWRAVPAGRSWVPGSWQRSAAGFRWVSGYWGVAAQEETEYLPPPPAPVETGPSIPSPGDNYNYVPGLWVYQVNRYVWRPGYWLGYRPGWVWTPACYRWTPCGYIYVPGFWDVPLLDRGLLFAPVRFTGGLYLRPGFIYRPAYCVQPDFLCGALFVRAGAPRYYFGDYFGARYRAGFTPWVDYRFARGAGFDVNFSYYRGAYRGQPGWERGLSGLYAGRYAGTIAAPPRTLVQQTTVVNNITVNKITNNVVGKNVNITNLQNVSALAPVKSINRVNVTALSSLAGGAPGAVKPPVNRPIRVERLTPARLQEERNSVTRYNTIARERRDSEAKLVTKAPTAPTAAPLRAKIELPKGTPPAREIKSAVTAPPGRPKTEWQPTTKPAPVLKPPVTTPPATKPATPPPAAKPAPPPPVMKTAPPPAKPNPPAPAPKPKDKKSDKP